MSIRLTGLFSYPLKSAGGQSLEQAELDRRGLRDDRMWMVIDTKTKTFLTQRQHPALALVQVAALSNQALRLQLPEQAPLQAQTTGSPLHVHCWDAVCTAYDAGDQAAASLSDYLQTDCRLVRMAEDFYRPVTSSHFDGMASTSFTDGFPLLLISQASLDALNQRLETPVPMDRFRPNLVIDGCEAFAEDSWQHIRIGNIAISVCKPCPRCPVITVNQHTASKHKEPLQVLASFRKQATGVCFGQNCVHQDLGSLTLGDELEVLS